MHSSHCVRKLYHLDFSTIRRMSKFAPDTIILLRHGNSRFAFLNKPSYSTHSHRFRSKYLSQRYLPDRRLDH